MACGALAGFPSSVVRPPSSVLRLAFCAALPHEGPHCGTLPSSPDRQMTDFVAARRMMVDGQVRTSDVTDLRLITAMLAVPRERFLPPAQQSFAYFDLDLPLAAEGTKPLRHLIKPMVLAKLIQAADIREQDRVLDVGCGSGYSTALLAALAGSVVALE